MGEPGVTANDTTFLDELAARPCAQAHDNPSVMTADASQIRQAYAQCRRIARRHYENFPVASYLVPSDKRDALAAIYAFARTADDFADETVEGSVQPPRLERLAEWRRKLRACYGGESHRGATVAGGARASAWDPIFRALGDAVSRFGLSEKHFENLLRAFEWDVTGQGHADFASLLNYCACSANPVGRLVLELFGHRDPGLGVLSDSLCTGLQLANFWQDVARDFSRHRVYLPIEDLARFDDPLDELRAGRLGERWRQLMAFEIDRTREFFQRSKILPEIVAPSLRRQLRLTWLGGMTILAKIQSVGYDVLHRRPRLTRWDFVRLYLKARRALGSAPGDAQGGARAVASPS